MTDPHSSTEPDINALANPKEFYDAADAEHSDSSLSGRGSKGGMDAVDSMSIAFIEPLAGGFPGSVNLTRRYYVLVHSF